MKPTSLYLALCLVALSVGPASADRVIRVEPGLWEYSHTLEIPGLLTPIRTPRTQCIKAQDAEQNLSDFLGDLSDGSGCTVSALKDNLNTVKFDLACRRDVGTVTMTANGNMSFKYGRTAITGEATGSISIGDAQMGINARGAARRVGRCDG